jgi:hypothetical protein
MGTWWPSRSWREYANMTFKDMIHMCSNVWNMSINFPTLTTNITQMYINGAYVGSLNWDYWSLVAKDHAGVTLRQKSGNETHATVNTLLWRWICGARGHQEHRKKTERYPKWWISNGRRTTHRLEQNPGIPRTMAATALEIAAGTRQSRTSFEAQKASSRTGRDHGHPG